MPGLDWIVCSITIWFKAGRVVSRVVYTISLACCMFMSWIRSYQVFNSLYVAFSCL